MWLMLFLKQEETGQLEWMEQWLLWQQLPWVHMTTVTVTVIFPKV
jgi:hypothetical protein